MPALTRPRYKERQDCWHVFYGDVHAGTIARRVGNPHHTEPWEWSCGFYPSSEPGEIQSGTAKTFDDARAEFENAWHLFLSKRTEADFQAWRDQRDWTERKYALWAEGKIPTPPRLGPLDPPHRYRRCPCGEAFDTHTLAENLIHVQHISAMANPR